MMKCTIKGCQGHYEHRRIVHTVKHAGVLMVFDDVPADVCDVCSDTLLQPETIRHLEGMLRKKAEPKTHIPVFAYA